MSETTLAPGASPRSSCLRLFLFFLLTLSLGFPSVARPDEQKTSLTLDEIARTDAAKYYIAKQYAKSLEEFQRLEAQYPKSVLIKRYIASLYDSLFRREEAIAKLKEALELKKDDWIARQLLGDIYMKQAELDLAQQNFEILLKQDPEGKMGQYAKKKIEEIKSLKQMPQTQEGKKMAVQDFMKSAAAQAFGNGKYV